ncbi:hypothetical protein [Variovorax sp. HW608]|uniref:hypothetical protein n=1 Tax=Variovorax sp. HW608 TaxID=1034889 RepID=UPI000B5AFAC9|nr:hypothetical protein [Variovorax sp. HW608]
MSALRSVLRGLATQTLNARAIGRILGLSVLIVLATAVALSAIDPTPRGIGSVYGFALADDLRQQSAILDFWRQNGLAHRARLFVILETLALAPAAAIALLSFGVRLRQLLAHDRGTESGPGARPTFVWFCLLVFAALLVTLAANLLTLLAISRAASTPGWIAQGTHVAQWIKLCLWGLAVVYAGLWFAHWYFALDPPDAPDPANTRSRMRADIADILWRSKFAIAILVAHGALVLLMDQTRDGLVRQVPDAADPPGMQWGMLLGLLLTAAALWLLAYASWLWPRLLLRLATPGRERAPGTSSIAFATWWARILGLAPFGAVSLAIAWTLRDQPAGSPGTRWLAGFLVGIGVLAMLYLSVVTFRRHDPSAGYYQTKPGAEEARADMGLRPFWVAWAPPLLFMLVRLTSLQSWTPPLALGVITSGLAAWAGIVGWVAYLSRRNAVPYLFAAFGVYALFGILGWSEVHGIRTDRAPEAADLARFLWTAALGLPCVALACWLYRRDVPSRGWLAIGVPVLLAIIAVLKLHDRPPQTLALPERPSLEGAVAQWLGELARQEPRPGEGALPVYVISAEGGGIRSAYWTASILARLKGIDPDFDQRTFAISAVSGGALGVAAFRSCELEAGADAARLQGCVDRMGGADLWTQLLGGLLFEDALASALPTSLFCRSPGCGLLGRSYWFEGAIEGAVPRMATGLAASGDGRRPHLLLTVTRVETGERWIQSDLAIDWRVFPAACDVLGMLGSDLRLSTAAHNSSRFPYTNPVGALYGSHCTDAGDKGRAHALRARLQDGGYFDDSAASTSSDILRMIDHCLFGRCGALSPPGDAEAALRLERLRARLRPIVIAIRNEDRFAQEAAHDPEGSCNEAGRRDPALPRDRSPSRVVPALLSSPVTLYQTREAHMHAFDAQIAAEAYQMWDRLGLTAQPSATPCGSFANWAADRPIHRFDLVADGLYPSGWVLSKSAMNGIRRQADSKVGATAAAAAAQ